MIRDYLSLALNSIRSRRLRSWLTMIGIFIGVASVVALISLGQGLQEAINSEFASFGIDKVIIQGKSAGFGAPGTFSAGKVTEDDLKLIKKVSGVENAAGRIIKTATIEFGNEQQARAVSSLPNDNREASLIIDANNFKLKDGRMLKSSDRNKVVLGYDYAYGKLFSKKVYVGNRILINGKQFEVVGILERLGDPFRDKAVLMNQDALQDLYGSSREFNALVAQAKKGEDINKVAEDIAKAMRKDRSQKEGREDFEIQTPQQFLNSFNVIFGIVQAVVIGIAGISILVGSIGIMNTMYTAVIERTREIGIMKATGARNEHILSLFLAESGMLGMAGGAIGVALGMGIGKLVEFSAQKALGSSLLQAYFPWYLIAGSLLFSFIIGAVSGVLPAMQASRLKPADALRYE
ncbi:ABC transporter permease [Candidatus Woesearchaeota archaeon]|nr:ABC transporter permease [Candidatus Woesearchaeota archaeon]